MDLSNISEEQKAKFKACETPEEMLAAAREEGYELSEEELQAVSGGGQSWSCIRNCDPICPEHGYSPL